MSGKMHPMVQLLEQDQRYKLEAYQFVSEALVYAQDVMRLHEQNAAEQIERQSCSQEPTDRELEEEEENLIDLDDTPPEKQSHITGQQLCEAIRQYALDQYGYLAKTVLNSWGVHATGDFGEIVYNLIRIRQMRKSDSDRREDFDDVYDFANAFAPKFEVANYRS